MTRKIVVTSALPYANGPIHIGHLVEYIQTDIWVRFHKLCGRQCLYFCADDTHGTPVMLSARAAGIPPEQLIETVHREHTEDFERFHVDFDNYYSTHSPENQHFSELFFKRLNEAGAIVKREVEQAFCETCNISLPDRYVKGTCPRCKAEDQYGDSCEVCSATYRPTDMINAYCATCRAVPVLRSSEHYFFKLADFEERLKVMIGQGYTQPSVSNKLQEWFDAGLKDWDISRDGPYFGFKIPGESDKYFYVWLDAPIGYIASAKNYCDREGLDFDRLWPGEHSAPSDGDEYELYHFIGKDIMYFHALFWPAMLQGAGFKTARKLFVHGFLTVNGEKMSKRRGTFIKAATYAEHLDAEYLRYYYASKLNDNVNDLDLSVEDFVNKVNSDLVGKFANLASRSGPMLTRKLQGRLGQLDADGWGLIDRMVAEKAQIVQAYEELKYGAVVRHIVALADEANRFVESKRPWDTLKTDLELTRVTLTAVINAVRVLAIYLKPILPVYAQKVERFLGLSSLTMADLESVLENHSINPFEHLFKRVETKQVEAMMESSKEIETGGPGGESKEDTPSTKEQCDINDFGKIDLRVAAVKEASAVEGADKLLRLTLDVGSVERSVLAGIALAYKPEDLVGRKVVYFSNLKPRKMRFGVSEGMVLAAGGGGKAVYLLAPDEGAQPGDEIR